MTTLPVPHERDKDGVNRGTSPARVTEQAFADFAERDSENTLLFSEDEQTLLSLYDHLHELELETALLESQNAAPSGNINFKWLEFFA